MHNHPGHRQDFTLTRNANGASRNLGMAAGAQPRDRTRDHAWSRRPTRKGTAGAAVPPKDDPDRTLAQVKLTRLHPDEERPPLAGGEDQPRTLTVL